jgi:hypothetical protein
MQRLAILVFIAFIVSFGGFAESVLTKSATLPSTDGVIGASEYQFSGTVSGIKVYATLGSDDTLYLAVEAPTSGWVAAGLGGLVMNGSRLFLGAIQDGKPAFIEKAGVGHFYTDAKELVIKKWAVKTKGEDTVLELSLPASAAVWKGQVNAIFAYSKTPSFTNRHAARGALSFTIK